MKHLSRITYMLNVEYELKFQSGMSAKNEGLKKNETYFFSIKSSLETLQLF